jgi:predicted nucleic acid-binding protein
MPSGAVRAVCFDASVLVALHLDEDGSAKAKEAFNGEPTKYTTAFCFYETLTLLKVHLLYRAKDRGRYLQCCHALAAWFGSFSDRYQDIDLSDPLTFALAYRIADTHGLDLSDALQIASVRHGFFSGLVGDSTTILATADLNLARAARAEGLRVWSVLDEDRP